ncbi:MAG: chloride channel protein [Clostridia bacterium]|nr:chloride channel protein [Clostridia bacterium]
MNCKKLKNQLLNFIVPAFVFGSLTGVLTALTVTLYKICAHFVISLSQKGYEALSARLYLLPAVLAVLAGVAFLFAFLYKKIPNLRGGGIPTSIGILRGILSFQWLKNLLGIFFLSLTTFMIGVPLGNEGPAVQMGTAVGRGTVFSIARKHRAWDRYSMTGGACAGFATATGAPISGILFAIEEAHQRISPMIVIVSAASVMSARLTSELIAPLCGVSIGLFPAFDLPVLSAGEIWLPALVGVAVGLFAVLFLRYYRLVSSFFSTVCKKIPHGWKIFSVFAVTLLLGLCSFSFISTGHDLILDLLEDKVAIGMLLLLLLVRSTLTLSANANGITGGLFIPIMTLGVLVASILAKGLLPVVGEEQFAMILVLGITACISGMMKTPLTAILFAVEALGCSENLLPVVVAASLAFVIPELFGAASINDVVLERRAEEHSGKTVPKVFDTFVTVKEGSFAVGKQIRDIFWPANLFVLSVKHDETRRAEVDEHGGKELRAGDVLHVRYSTSFEEKTREELIAIVGAQEYREKETDVI